MYGNGPNVMIRPLMPVAGGGGMYLAWHAHQPTLLVVAVLILAVWTVFLGVRAIGSIVPKAEY